MNNNKILLVYSQLATGGVETLIIRMSNWLVENGYNVNVLLIKKSDLDQLFSKKVNVKYFGWKYDLLFNPYFNKQVVKSSFFKEIDILYSFDLKTCWLSSLIYKNLDVKPKFVTGVYHPDAFSFYKKHELRFFHSFIKNNLTDNSIFFMNKECKISIEQRINYEFAGENIFPLPIEIPTPIEFNSFQKEAIKIVSIGRLVSFKTYNIHMLDIIFQLKKEGFNIEYFIYGDGKLEMELKEKISLLDLKDNVFLMGKLNYEEIRNVLTDAYLFIGMGTSLIEAAVLGVPSIIAIVNDEEKKCYGFFQNMEGFSVGEIIKGQKSYSLNDTIKDSISWSKSKYLNERIKSIQKGKLFGMDPIMNNFLKLVSQNSVNTIIKVPNSDYNRYFFLNLIRSVLIKIRNRINSFFNF